MLAAIAKSSSEAGRRSAITALRHVHVDAKREQCAVHDERRHAEADKGIRHAGQWQHGQVAGDGDCELAQRQHDPHDADPADERLRVRHDTVALAGQSWLSARDPAVVADQPVQPQRASERECPRGGGAERADQCSERVVALDLRGNARTGRRVRKAAPWNRAEAGAACWNQLTMASWSFADASGASRFSSRSAVTGSTAPSVSTETLIATIHAANRHAASAAGARVAPVRTCHHIATDAARNAPAAYEAISSGPMSRVTSIMPTSTSPTKPSGQA